MFCSAHPVVLEILVAAGSSSNIHRCDLLASPGGVQVMTSLVMLMIPSSKSPPLAGRGCLQLSSGWWSVNETLLCFHEQQTKIKLMCCELVQNNIFRDLFKSVSAAFTW